VSFDIVTSAAASCASWVLRFVYSTHSILKKNKPNPPSTALLALPHPAVLLFARFWQDSRVVIPASIPIRPRPFFFVFCLQTVAVDADRSFRLFILFLHFHPAIINSRRRAPPPTSPVCVCVPGHSERTHTFAILLSFSPPPSYDRHVTLFFFQSWPLFAIDWRS